MFFDTHTHLHFNAYQGETDEAIKRALDNQTWVLLVGTQQSTSELAVELAEKFGQGVYAAVGLHPIHLHEQEYDVEESSFRTRAEKFDYDYYKKLAGRPGVVAIGETGLDYFHLPKGLDPEAVKKEQQETFRRHCDLANELNLPLNVHCREAQEDILNILEEYAAAGKLRKRGVAHCFAGNWSHAQRYLKIGFYISFNGTLTFPPRKTNPQPTFDLIEVAKKTPLDRLVLETDAPYLTPVPHRGKRNESYYVKFTAAKLAELRKAPLQEIEEAAFANARHLLNV